jgi:hypothetical protein
LIQRYRAALADEIEQRERQQFDRLKAKYGSDACRTDGRQRSL